MNMKPAKDAKDANGAKALNGNGAKQEPSVKQEQTMAQPLAENKMENPILKPEPESKSVSIPSPKPAHVQKTAPTLKVPIFLSSYADGAAAYNGHLIPAYLKLSKILSNTMKGYTLGKIHSKIQSEIRHLKDFTGDYDLREEAMARFVKQLAAHVLAYEARASINLHKKNSEMKAVNEDDIDYLLGRFDFRPWDR